MPQCYSILATPSSRIVAEAFQKKYLELGGNISSFQFYIDGTESFDQQIEYITTNKVAVVLLPNATRETRLQIEILRQSGFNGKILGSDNWSPLKTTNDSLFEGAFYVHHWHPEYADYNSKAKIFLNEYRDNYAEDPTSMSALTYDALAVLSKAIEHSGRNNIDILSALKIVGKLDGVTGEVDLRSANKHDKTPVIITIKNNTNKLYRSPTWELK